MTLTNPSFWVASAVAVLVSISMLVSNDVNTTAAPLTIDKAQITINQKGQRVYQGRPFTGDMVSYHDSGKIATADQFVNGRRQGYAKKWFASGTLGYESFYSSGARHGETNTWWFNGNPRSQFYYVKGKTEGVGKRWYRSGAIFKKFNYSAGRPVGLQQAWRKNGKLFSNFEYKNGRIYGLRKANNCVGLEDEAISPQYYQNQANSTL